LHTDKRSIQILPVDLANKIAAGEVIQRPASVVKEALENSIDAGSRNIVVTIRDSGKTFIQVADDGTGIPPADLGVAFERHSTSKIRTYDDLGNIRTLGFRGEALSSIAAVSQVEIKSRIPEEPVGTVLRLDGSAQHAPEPCGMEQGTTLTVKNLFYNTPARRNFLKTDATEFRHVLDTVQRAALSNPDIAFTFMSDYDTVFRTAAGDLYTRIRDLFGEELSEGLMECNEETDYLTVYGFLAKPEYSRRTRNEQFLFLNRRYIINRSINHAVYRAYEHLLIKGSYPFYVLFIDVEPSRIDVNIHPSKLEAKFDDERSVYGIVTAVVRKTLAQHDMMPSLSMIDGADGGMSMKGAGQTHHHSPLHILKVDRTTGEIIEGRDGERHGDLSLFRTGSFSPSGRTASSGGTDTASGHAGQVGEAAGTESGVESGLIFQLHNKYILAQIRSGLLIIDQHVAHERILYERALKRFASEDPASQQLLFPETVDLGHADVELVREMLPLLHTLGFDLKIFSKNTIVIEGIPADVRPGYEHNILKNVIEEYRSNAGTQLDVRDNLAKSFACRSAIKSGDRLSDDEMRDLIDQLFGTDMPYVCPHGRPVVIKLTVDELDRKFGRT
jgi:DNA mismatch repair protein MutL